jgi:hypothetical protein
MEELDRNRPESEPLNLVMDFVCSGASIRHKNLPVFHEDQAFDSDSYYDLVEEEEKLTPGLDQKYRAVFVEQHQRAASASYGATLVPEAQSQIPSCAAGQ